MVIVSAAESNPISCVPGCAPARLLPKLMGLSYPLCFIRSASASNVRSSRVSGDGEGKRSGFSIAFTVTGSGVTNTGTGTTNVSSRGTITVAITQAAANNATAQPDRRASHVRRPAPALQRRRAGDLVVEPYLITLTEDAVPYTAFQHEGVEFIYMLSGEVIYAHADRSYRLRAGDAMLFDSSAPHGPMELVSKPMTYLSIITFLRGER